MSRFLTLLLTFLWVSANVLAQSKWIPPSPTAYSFSKYGEIPVSNYTGVPEISIPLANLKEIDAETNVSISYHSAGIKVDEIASWVGLGWNLNAGGCISRTVNGTPEYPDPITGTIKPTRTILGFPNPQNSNGSFTDLTYMQNAQGPSEDLEPDIFMANFNGRSCKFVFDETGHCRMYNYQDWDIKFLPCFPGNGSTQSESKFIITTEDGTKYEFNARDYINHNYGWVPSAWYLTKIESSNGNIITFEYSVYDAQQFTHSKTYELSAQNYTYFTPSPDNPTLEQNISRKEVLLTRIITNNSGWIEFKQNTLSTNKRKDYYNPYNYPLDEVVIYNKDGEAIKRIKFYTSYFVSSDYSNGQFVGVGQYPYANLQHLRYRLRLDSIKEFTGNNQFSLPAYKFKYYNEINSNLYNLPYRLAPSQDHWGYYNAANTNSNLVPNIDWTVYSGFWMSKFFNIGDDYSKTGLVGGGGYRETDSEAMKACVLNKLFYPTGGRTEFIFEANDYSYFSNTLCGGLRIKYIRNFDEKNLKVNEKEFVYREFDIQTKTIQNTSSGCLIDHPKNYYVTVGKVECHNDGFRPEYGSDLASDLGNPYSGLCYYNDTKGTYNYIFKISAQPTINLGSALSTPVGYSTVIVKEPGNGYSVYEYTNPTEYPNYTDPYEIFDLNLNSLNLFQTQYSTTFNGNLGTIFVDPFANNYLMHREKVKSSDWPNLPPYENDWKRGHLKYSYQYSNENKLVGYQENEYYLENLYNTQGYIVKNLRYNAATDFLHGKYLIPSGWSALKKQKSYYCNDNGQNWMVEKRFEYGGNNHKFLTVEKVIDSKGNEIVKRLFYPKDNPTGMNTTSQTIDAMITKNMISPVLKEEVKVNDANFASGRINNFKIDPSNHIQISDIKIARTDGVYEAKEKFNKYDTKGNITEYIKTSDDLNVTQTNSFYWSYNGTLPVIKADNVDYTALSNAVNALRGDFENFISTNIKSLSTDLQKAAWRQFNNELREYATLKKGFITTYTYAPLIGMTSQTDPNGVTTYYEYDSFGRLKCIKDDDGRILKTYEYNYKQ